MHLDPACGTQEQMTVLPPSPPIEPHQPLVSFATQQPADAIELQKLQTFVPQSNAQSNSSNNEQEILTYDKCPQCGGKIKILWGAKFKSYYWHCDSCGKNISINYKCPKCHEKLRIQKLGKDYYIYCIICGLQEHYFTDIE
jgi:transcription elongation factor Elf1